MAKLNNVNSEEVYPWVTSFLGSVGVLVCFIITVMGIKLWWFKYRMDIEQTSIQNGAAGGQTPDVVVTRREKKSKYSKDKRWSQEVYQSVDVHGVFKLKDEDEVEIQRPQQLPPVRIRHCESTPSLIMPSPRNKRREEEVICRNSEGIYETIEPIKQEATSSPTAVMFNEKDTRISFTFEDFKKQLKLKREEEEAEVTIEQLEKPLPPKRTNRSNSNLSEIKDEKKFNNRFLKSSKSIAANEYRNVMDERRATGFHRPTENDLSKIPDIEEPRFEQFGDRRPTGYIKYEEVDFVISEVRRDFEDHSNNENGDSLDNPRYIEPLDALRNEQILYQQNESKEPLYINNIERGLPKDYIIEEDSGEFGLQNSPCVGNCCCDDPHIFEDSTSWNHIDLKAKEVHNLSPINMDPQPIVFYDDEEYQHIYSEPLKESAVVRQIPKNIENVLIDSKNSESFENLSNENLESKILENLAQEQRDERDSETLKSSWKYAKSTESSDLQKEKIENNFIIQEIVHEDKLNSSQNEFLVYTGLKESQEYDQRKTLNRDGFQFSETLVFDKEDNENIEYVFNQKEITKANNQRENENFEKEDLYEDIHVPDKTNEDLSKESYKPVIEYAKEYQIHEDKIDEIKSKPDTNSVKKHPNEFSITTTETALNESKAIWSTTEIETVVRRPKPRNSEKDYTTSLWLELEEDIALDCPHNIDDEFNKIRHSLEMNEADFLEIQDQLQLNSPQRETLPSISSIESMQEAFGKTIEEDWDNFEKLKLQTKDNQNQYEIIQGPRDIQIAFDAEPKKSSWKHNSILKESKDMEGTEMLGKAEAKPPKKTKVTFDFNTEEHLIPARRTLSDEEEDEEEEEEHKGLEYDDYVSWEEDDDIYDDDDDDEYVYTKPPPPIPTQRKVFNTKTSQELQDYKPMLSSPSNISLFGSQISPDDCNDMEDKWSAIRKHRVLTSQFQNLSLNTPFSPPPPLPQSPPPTSPPLPLSRNLQCSSTKASGTPKAAYRNPLAQLAIQRAKEVRLELGGFKSRSIKDSKQAKEKRNQQEMLNIKNETEDTEA